MDKLISKQEAIDLWEKYHPTIAVDAMQYDAELRQLPPTQLERKTGKWIWQTCSRYMCSECGRITDVDECMEEPMYTYCPYCGAPMVVGKAM